MDWKFEDFESDLNDLNTLLRKKAIEITEQLIDKDGYDHKKALEE